MFSKLKFSLLDYSNEYIAYVNPKIIISFLDNYRTFYKIKKMYLRKKLLYKIHGDVMNLDFEKM